MSDVANDNVPQEWLTKRVRTIVDLVETFSKRRDGEVPYEDELPCPGCGVSLVRFVYKGPRNVKMACDNEECKIRIVG